VAETCSGSATACPTDTLKAPGTLCRAATGACDPAESCTGGAPICPADVTNCTGGIDAGIDGGSDAGACTCSGTGPEGPVTVSCGQSACGSNYITYACDVSGWSWTGQACTTNRDAGAGPCQCTGTGPGGVPVTVSCGQSACGSNYTTYACSADGWTETGPACTSNSDAGAGPCQCIGTGPGGVPVTVNCGQSACGSDYTTYACSAGGWTETGPACTSNSDAGSCQCTGTGPGGVPVTVNCGQSACGSNYITYACSSGGWSDTGLACTGNGDAGVCQCSGTGPGGVPVTVNCGQSACGSNYISYACSADGWSWTGLACGG
jgi:hypothetical protein